MVTTVVEVRDLNQPPLRHGEAHAPGETDAAVEVRLEGPRAIRPLQTKEVRFRQGADRRKRQNLVINREAIAHRQPAPGQESAHRVVVLEGGGAKGEVETALPLQIETDGPYLLADPGVDRREVDRIRRGPEISAVLARGR